MDSRKFFQDNGDNTVRINYDLNENSIVYDIGFYDGSFAEKIVNKYNCYIYGYEPVKAYYEKALERFKNNHKVNIKNYGLSDKDQEFYIEDLGVGTSIFKLSENLNNKIYVKNIITELSNNKHDCIDLMKINIEGAEYQLLAAVLEKNLHKKIKNLQIQFHKEYESLITREKIQNELEKTHYMTYNYEYVWENWRLK